MVDRFFRYIPPVTTTICLIGTTINVLQHWSCFVFWIIGNIFWMILDARNRCWSRVLLSIVQTCFAVWGLLAWL